MDKLEIKKIYKNKRKEIDCKLGEFKNIWQKQDKQKIFEELVFCLLTPQSKAKICWDTVEQIKRKSLLWKGSKTRLAQEFNRVRFKNNKARFVYIARNRFKENGKASVLSKLKNCSCMLETRDWLVLNIKGMGCKEASHFLRNIGLGCCTAILDRHILKNLKALKIINEIPKSLSRKKYLEIEQKMIKFAKKIRIPVDALDLVLWSKETGEIFK